MIFMFCLTYFFCGIVLYLKGLDAMKTLVNFYFGNINPSEYRQSKDTKKPVGDDEVAQ